MPLLRKARLSILLVITASTLWVGVALSQNNISHNPTWWDKYQYIVHNGPTDGGGGATSVSIGANPIWTDSRRQLDPIPGCSSGLAMEEVFTATIKKVP